MCCIFCGLFSEKGLLGQVKGFGKALTSGFDDAITAVVDDVSKVQERVTSLRENVRGELTHGENILSSSIQVGHTE